jgi:hypothetical protein
MFRKGWRLAIRQAVLGVFEGRAHDYRISMLLHHFCKGRLDVALAGRADHLHVQPENTACVLNFFGFARNADRVEQVSSRWRPASAGEATPRVWLSPHL